MYLILLLTTRGPAHTKSCTAGVPKPRLASTAWPRCPAVLPEAPAQDIPPTARLLLEAPSPPLSRHEPLTPPLLPETRCRSDDCSTSSRPCASRDCRPLGQPSSLHILRLSFSPARIWTLRTRNNILWKLIKHS